MQNCPHVHCRMPYQPHRGDSVDAFIKAWRDLHQEGSTEWHALDCLIDEYREAADTGTPLARQVAGWLG